MSVKILTGLAAGSVATKLYFCGYSFHEFLLLFAMKYNIVICITLENNILPDVPSV